MDIEGVVVKFLVILCIYMMIISCMSTFGFSCWRRIWYWTTNYSISSRYDSLTCLCINWVSIVCQWHDGILSRQLRDCPEMDGYWGNTCYTTSIFGTSAHTLQNQHNQERSRPSHKKGLLCGKIKKGGSQCQNEISTTGCHLYHQTVYHLRQIMTHVCSYCLSNRQQLLILIYIRLSQQSWIGPSWPPNTKIVQITVTLELTLAAMWYV